MVEDVYEPLAAYRDGFRDRFAAFAKAEFLDLEKRSGVDAKANRALAQKVAEHQAAEAKARSKRLLLGLFMFLAAAGAVAAGYFAWRQGTGGSGVPPLETRRSGFQPLETGGSGVPPLATELWVACVIALAAAIAPFWTFRRLGREADEAARAAADGIEKGFRQMAPLNALYTWDIPVRLIEKTVPRLQFDPFFATKRLADLRRLFGWDDGFNDGKSILFAQSGVINANPFVFGEYLETWWGEKTYTGSKVISWTERETDSNGRSRTVTRYETLTASVTKPCPEYARRKVLVYGNDAAPNLVFTRRPFGETRGAGAAIKKKWRIWSLRRFSRNLEDDSDYTIMSNHDFEALFCTKDRNNEVEYRLLFTALAQRQMAALINDHATGYGDDFTFIKRRRLNLIHAAHLDAFPIDTDPDRFRHWSLEEARANFVSFNCEYFRSVYFALAPLLAIPLYQQTRTHEDIYRGVIPPSSEASFWECEAAANCHGEDAFRHPASITRNILKTRRRDGGVVEVTAHGHRGVKHVEHVSVWGRDGKSHRVPVEWIEYIPVQRTTAMMVSEGQPLPGTGGTANPNGRTKTLHRRSIYSRVL